MQKSRLRRAEGSFEVLITTDQNLKHQQNLTGRKIAIIVLPSNKVAVVAALAAEVDGVLQAIKAGEVVVIQMPP